MGKVYELHNRGQRAEEASAWISRLDRELSSAEKIEIRRWIAHDPRNKDMLSEMAGLWDDMDALSRLSELFPNPVTERDGSRRRRNFGIAAGVAILAAVLVSAYVADDPVRDVAEPVAIAEPAIYRTAIGVLSEFSLPDGSLLTLNTNSSVEVRFDSWQRNIRMLRGELHIEVAHDADRPLNVLVGDRVFQAVGVGTSHSLWITLRLDHSLTFRKAHNLLSIFEDSSTETVHEESSDFSPLRLLCITLRLDRSLTFRKAQNLLSILEYSSPGDVHE